MAARIPIFRPANIRGFGVELSRRLRPFEGPFPAHSSRLSLIARTAAIGALSCR
jgi:hypothetical protein